MEPSITIYTSFFCPTCTLLKDFLHTGNIPYKEVNIETQPLQLAKLITTTKRFSVPQTCIEGEWIFGFDPVKILRIMQDIPQRETEAMEP